jgi:nicotinamidase/pyrazinamidase
VSPSQRETVDLAASDALLVVDVQNDFLPGGQLAVPHGDGIIPSLNRYIALFEQKALPIFASRDWHPPDHCSFHGQGGKWPPHCVAGSPGAELAADLRLPSSTLLVSKAVQKNRESYSAFDLTELALKLHERGVRRVFIGGLATEYCVLSTVEDALQAGFEAVLLVDAIAAMESEPGAGAQAIQSMLGQGARAISQEDLVT